MYQVKGFAERTELTSSDKSKIASSLKKLLDQDHGDSRWEHLNVTEWHLVMPLDPTRKTSLGSRSRLRPTA